MPWTRRRFNMGLLAAGCGLASCRSLPNEMTAQRPNHLFLMVDDLNDWITALGGHPQTRTPHMDRLAKRGTVFANAHAQAPICGPSRASLLSGLRPDQTGIYGQILDPALKTAIARVSPTLLLPEYFSRAGYRTAGRGKISHQGSPEGMLDEYIPRETEFGPSPKHRFKWFDPRTHTDWGAYPARDQDMQDYQAAKWGAQYLDRAHDAPFFLAIGFVRPHVPWYVPQRWLDMFPLDEVLPPPVEPMDLADVPERGRNLVAVPQMPTLQWAKDSDEWRPMVQAYLACIAFVDHCIGILVDAADASASKDNIIITLMSDNGYHLGEKERFAKMSLWQRSTRVPLIISGPGISHNVVTDPVGLIDLYPTLVEISGLPRNRANAGTSLKPYLTGNSQRPARPITAVYGRGNYAVIDAHHRYIRYDDGSEELYDHRADPNEWRNIADLPQYADIKAMLAAQIPDSIAPEPAYAQQPD